MTIDGPTAGALEWANQHFLLVASKMEKLGVPRPVAQRLYSTDLVAITFTPANAFDQTPGEGAGRKR